MSTWKDDRALAENPTVTAPCCGRHVAADMLVNVSALPEAKRTTKKRPLEYACDGCVERLYRTGKVRPSELAQAAGADPAKVQRLRAKEG